MPPVTGPYCGAAPAPAELAYAWNSDWRIGALLALVAAAMWVPGLVQNRRLFLCAWLGLGVAFVSPLCALTVALFSARAVHHLLLLAVVAPMLGAAMPALARGRHGPVALVLLLVALVAWHLPAAYSAAWRSHAVYACMQLALLVPAAVFWSGVWSPLRQQVQSGQSSSGSATVAVLAQLVALAGAMGLIGAVLTFAPRPLYLEHGAATLAYGLSALEDQQLAGLLMWVPGMLPVAAVACALVRGVWRSAALPTPGRVAP